MKNILYILIAIVVVGGGYLLFKSAPTTPTTLNNERATTTPVSQSAGATSTPTTSSGFTKAEVATHNSASSCYTIISGKVYDLTKWISQHPGGERAILSICGKDGTAPFEGQHGGQSKQINILASFFIGNLTQ